MKGKNKVSGFFKGCVAAKLRWPHIVVACSIAAAAQAGPGTSDRSLAPSSSGREAAIDTSSLYANLEDPYGLAGEQDAQNPAPQSSSKRGVILGTVLDQSGAVSVGTVVRLTPGDSSAYHEVVSGNNGQFSFSAVAPGPFRLSVSSTGFESEVFSGELQPGQTLLVPPIVLSVATVVTEVKVTVDPVQVATEQVKEQEHQRVLGFIPNFYVSYHPDAPPLTRKLKFQLAWKSSTDPITIAGAAFLAGLQQAGNEYPEFGQGMEGYGKRLGAAYGDVFASTFLSGAVFPTLLKQDPRYFYKGTGSTKSRILYALGNSVICKGDNGKWQGNYSNIAGIVSGAAITSTYYPTSNQGSTILSNSFVRLGESSLAGIFQEFVARKLTKPPKPQALTNSELFDPSSVQNK